MPHPFADYLILSAIRDTGGTAVAVSDEEMMASIREMASLEGVFPCPEGASTLAGLKRLLQEEAIDRDGTRRSTQ